MTFTNSEIQTMFLGIQHIVMVSPQEQRKLPMLPSVRLKRMMDDLEDYYERINEARQDKEKQLSEFRDELKDKVDDEGSDYDADDMREELNSRIGDLDEEMEELMQEEANVEFGDPVSMSDVERIDEANDDYNFTASSAIDIILTKVVDNDGDS